MRVYVQTLLVVGQGPLKQDPRPLGYVPSPNSQYSSPNGESIQDKTKTTLMMEDLSAALAEYGITSRKPEFYM